eukprot:scaffold12923_cov64-Phaeocystis_antarctica.AAC.6
MLTDERRSKEATPWRSIDAAPRHCAPLPAALPEPQSSQILRAACAQPAAQSPDDARTCVSSYMGRAWHVRKKRAGSEMKKKALAPRVAKAPPVASIHLQKLLWANGSVSKNQGGDTTTRTEVETFAKTLRRGTRPRTPQSSRLPYN